MAKCITKNIAANKPPFIVANNVRVDRCNKILIKQLINNLKHTNIFITIRIYIKNLLIF
jgi:hypothetical protein